MNRKHLVVPVLAAICLAVSISAAPTNAAVRLTVSAPLTNAIPVLEGLPSCLAGPTGVVVDPGSIVVNDFCNHTTYRYDTTTGSPVLTAARETGLTHGLSRHRGVLYGVADINQSTIQSGVWSMSEDLVPGALVAPNTCGEIRDVVSDPTRDQLIFSGSCGLYRLPEPGAPRTAPALLTSGDFDGVAVDPVTDIVWAARNADDAVDGYSMVTGALVRSVAVSGGPDGIAIARSDARGVAGNMFVNTNDGRIVMIEPRKGWRTSVVASGGSRGDFVSVGPDGALYVTQIDSVFRVEPGLLPPHRVSPPQQDLRYVALGDSYSSGEGLKPFDKGSAGISLLPASDTATNTCHRSHSAYGQLVSPPPDVFAACSGRTTDAFYVSSMSNEEPAQRLWLNDYTGLVTLTLGGNDLDWPTTLTACIRVEKQVTHETLYDDADACQAAIETARGDIGRLQRRLTSVYRVVLRDAPNSQVRVLNYPPLFPDRHGARSGCRIARINVPTPSKLPVAGSATGYQLVIPADVERQLVSLQKSANRAIAAAVKATDPSGHQIRLVDVEKQFGGYTGHTTSCGDRHRPTPWLNAIHFDVDTSLRLLAAIATARWDAVRLMAHGSISASYHPTAEGQRQMYRALSRSLPRGWR